jgi:hypothetical protein
MVAINKFKKADLNQMGFVGTVVNMKKELRKIIKKEGINTKKLNEDGLIRKIQGTLGARALIRQERIDRSKKKTQALRQRNKELQGNIKGVRKELIAKGIDPRVIKSQNQLSRVLKVSEEIID